MALGWIDLQDYPFDCFALFERFQIRLICQNAERDALARHNLSIALARHPTVAFAFARRCPECADFVQKTVAEAPYGLTPKQVRRAELALMENAEDFVVYCYPEIMDQGCDFIWAWDKNRLYELVSLDGRIVLDVGSGSGRLAFAAAEKARHVYASEPVSTLREYLRDKIRRESISNITVVDGMVDLLPYPGDSFDIVMSGHVVGDDFEAELKELTRVVKNGGWILDCPGENKEKHPPSQELLLQGFEMFFYESPLGGDTYRYRKQIRK